MPEIVKHEMYIADILEEETGKYLYTLRSMPGEEIKGLPVVLQIANSTHYPLDTGVVVYLDEECFQDE